MTDRHQLLVLYRHTPAAADELRWCLRSLPNVRDCNPVPLVVGDPPDWYTGPQLRIPAAGSRRTDVRSKLRAIIASDLVADSFVLLADDNVIVRPIEYPDLQVPRSQTPRETAGDGWQALRFATAEFSRARGWPVVDVSTHWPYCWAKPLLEVTLDLLDGFPVNLLVESVYASMHNQPTQPAKLDFRYVWRGSGWCEDARVISYSDTAFLGGLRDRLAAAFPAPSPWETGPVPHVPIVGRLSPQSQHACRSLGPILRVSGALPIHSCSRFIECGPFGNHPRPCHSCPQYEPNPARLLTIGSPQKNSPTRRQCDTLRA